MSGDIKGVKGVVKINHIFKKIERKCYRNSCSFLLINMNFCFVLKCKSEEKCKKNNLK